MSRQHFFEPAPDRLKRTIPAAHFIDEIGAPRSPFLKETILSRVYRTGIQPLLWLIEAATSRTFLLENVDNELVSYSRSNRRLLTQLLTDGYISKWECGLRAVDKPAIPYCALTIHAIKNKHGATLMKGGMQGQGTGATLNEALTVALAETLERIALTEYAPESLSLHTLGYLTERRVRCLVPTYVEGAPSSDTPMNWVAARSLVSGKRLLVPASLVYLSYSSVNPWEPALGPCTSNSCAAYTDRETATLKAIYEGLERDGMLMYWLNGIAPKRIIIDESFDTDVIAIVAQLHKANIDLYFLDCHTEYRVPIIVTVLIDRVTGGVDVNAAAGFDTATLIRKVTNDALRWGVGYTAHMDDIANPIQTMEQRSQLWRGGHMRTAIDFFLAGAPMSWSEYNAQFDTDTHAPLKRLISIFRERGEDLLSLDLTNELARTSGLVVVRVIAPSLMPMYFDEALKPFGVPRLYSFARQMGFADADRTKDQLNTVPHPFV
jgi:thiazole/oxazole-forming peptide maturase SagD family component